VSRLVGALLVAWALGWAFFPLHGMIHFLLILVLALLVVDRAGRDATGTPD